MRKMDHYSTLAKLFSYPERPAGTTGRVEGFKGEVNACMEMLQMRYPDAADVLARFVEYVNNHSMDEIEEIFTITFHIQAICYLDIGYVLFGEDYKRGAFLVEMKREQAEVENDCGTELPDNLENVLNLMSKSEKPEFVDELSVMAVMPALDKMIGEFKAERMAMKQRVLKKKHNAVLLENVKHGNIYKSALGALLLVMQEDFKHVDNKQPEKVPEPTLAFLTQCSCTTPTNTSQNDKQKKDV